MSSDEKLVGTEIKILKSEFAQLEVQQENKTYGPDEVVVDNVFKRLRGGIADRQIAIPLDRWFKGAKIPLPTELDLGSEYRLWVIPNSVWVQKHGGVSEPVMVGVQIEYSNSALTPPLNLKMTCSIVSMHPSPEFLRIGGVAGGIKQNAEAAQSVAGVGVGGGAVPFSRDEAPGEPIALENGLTIGLRGTVKTSLYFSASVYTPIVSALGEGSSFAEWGFHSTQEAPLYGRNLKTWTILALPRDMGGKKLKYRIRMYFVASTVFLRSRHFSNWLDVECNLLKE